MFALIRERSIRAGQELMDDFVVLARAKCPSPDKPTHKMITRIPGSTIIRNIRFTPKRGRQKGKDVSFTARVWTGRIPGSLQESIRRVDKPSRPGNIRVYAGHYKVPYAHFVEYGTVKTRPQPFMRNTFAEMKPTVKRRIESEMAEEVRSQR